MTGPISRAFHVISSEYGWDDDMILDKTLRRIRQILVEITISRKERQKEERLMLSWQTRSLAMVMARASGTGDEELMKFAANLTIDNEEYEQFNTSNPVQVQKTPVHATTQDAATEANFNRAADKNSFEMLSMFGMSVEKTPPGQ